MPGRAVFNSKQVLALESDFDKAIDYKASFDQLFDPQFYPDGVVRDKNGKTEEQVEQEGGIFLPDGGRVDTQSIGPHLWLVGDHGLYIISNAVTLADSTPETRGTIAYAHGCNPAEDANFDDAKRCIFGGDDGVIAIDAQAVFRIARSRKRLTFEITESYLELIT